MGYEGNTRALTNFANNHGGLARVKEQWYVFYHRHTHGHQCSRQGCAEPVKLLEDGNVSQTEMTSCGLNGGPLAGKGTYSAAIACNLHGRDGGKKLIYGKYLEEEPCIFSEGQLHYIRNFAEGCVAGFKYFLVEELKKFTVTARGSAGLLKISDGRQLLAEIPLEETEEFTEFSGNVKATNGIIPLIFTYEGDGKTDLLSFCME